MKKKLNIKIFLYVVGIIVISSYLYINSIIGDDKFLKLRLFISNEKIQLIKKYIFPYKLIFQQEQKISDQEQKISQKDQSISQHNITLLNLELDKKEEGSHIKTKKSSTKLSNNKTLKKYRLMSGFYYGIYNYFPGSGYIEFFENDIFILSSRGILAFKKNLTNDEENFQQIKNNIDNFIGINQYKKDWKISLKDLIIINKKIYISFTEEIKKNCWNTSVIYGDINYESIQFKKLFSPKECIHSVHNVDKDFTFHSSGGRIQSFDKDHILLSVGEYIERYLAQDKKSVNGKIIKININNSDYEIISMGHRNPQGLYFDKENNFILETEHGPMGGDEINLIKIKKITKGKIPNYGWPMASAGEHYGGKNEGNKKKYEKYPLYKSHSKHGFIEPLKTFVPSIAISKIVKIGSNKYVVGSMRDKSLYFFELNEEREIINLDRVEVFERVRDLELNNNKLYLFMENTASIGAIDLKEN